MSPPQIGPSRSLLSLTAHIPPPPKIPPLPALTSCHQVHQASVQMLVSVSHLVRSIKHSEMTWNLASSGSMRWPWCREEAGHDSGSTLLMISSSSAATTAKWLMLQLSQVMQ